MKTERRHELQHNELADFLTDVGEKAKPYAKAILGVALAALVILCAYLYLNKRAESEEALSWDEAWTAINSRSQGALREVIDKYPNKPAAHWSQLVLADIELSRGETSLFSRKAEGRDQLRSAFEDYQHVKENAVHPLLREQALYGMARAQESLGELGKARGFYEEIFKNYPTGPYAKRAEQRIKDLDRESTKAWYDWFAQAQPVAADFSKTNPFGDPFGDSSGGKNLPPLPPGFVLPDLDKGKSPPPEPKPDTGKTDAGKADATKPVAGKPDPSKSDATKPDQAKPETLKPDAAAPDAAKPDKAAPDASKTDAAKPEPPKPEAGNAEATKPDKPKTDAPKPDAAK